MSEAFEYEYPLFIIAGSITPDPVEPITIFDGIVTLSAEDGSESHALFTDRPGAEESRDKKAPDSQIYEIPSVDEFRVVLQGLKQKACAVAFDPYRIGYRTPTLSIEEVLLQLSASQETPGEARTEE